MNLTRGVGDFFALDIGTNSIRLIQLSQDQSGGFSLQKFAYVPVGQDFAQDSSELGKRKMGETILGAMKQAGIRTKNIALGLPASQTFTTIIETPVAPLNEIRNTIKYQADQYIPMAVEDAKVDFAVLGLSPNDKTKAEVLISSTAVAFAEEKVALLEQLGLNVIAQEPEPLAMARALIPVDQEKAAMIIDLGERSTDIVIVYKGVPRLVRTIPGGLSTFVRTVTTTLEVPEDQARQFILKYGLAQDKLEGKVFQVLDSTLETFSQELMKSVRFFQNKYVGLAVSNVVLSGFAGIIPFIAEYIEVKTGITTTQGNPWQFVKVTPEQRKVLLPVASEFGVAIGLAERMNTR